jgi:hypothetical protein
MTGRTAKFGSPEARIVPGGAQIFHRLHTRLGCTGRPPQFSVEFYPYANLMHTIRLRDDAAHVRISDVLRGAPLPVFEAAAAILLARLYRRRAPEDLLLSYRRFIVAPRTRTRMAALRGKRGRRVDTGSRGMTYDLAPMFTRLNRRYFGGRLHRPRLGWSTRTWRTQFGCFDPALDQIVLSRWLDRPVVSKYAVEYVLFHEMLHVKHPLRVARCGLEAHSLKFRQEEKQYAHYQRARKFLDRLP